MNLKPAFISLAAAATLASAVFPVSAQDFYKGKTISTCEYPCRKIVETPG